MRHMKKRHMKMRHIKMRHIKMRENEYVGLTYCRRLMQEIIFKTIKSIKLKSTLKR